MKSTTRIRIVLAALLAMFAFEWDRVAEAARESRSGRSYSSRSSSRSSSPSRSASRSSSGRAYSQRSTPRSSVSSRLQSSGLRTADSSRATRSSRGSVERSSRPSVSSSSGSASARSGWVNQNIGSGSRGVSSPRRSVVQPSGPRVMGGSTSPLSTASRFLHTDRSGQSTSRTLPSARGTRGSEYAVSPLNPGVRTSPSVRTQGARSGSVVQGSSAPRTSVYSGARSGSFGRSPSVITGRGSVLSVDRDRNAVRTSPAWRGPSPRPYRSSGFGFHSPPGIGQRGWLDVNVNVHRDRYHHKHYYHRPHYYSRGFFGFGFLNVYDPVYPLYPVYAPPVYVEQPVYVQQPVVVQQPAVVQPYGAYEAGNTPLVGSEVYGSAGSTAGGTAYSVAPSAEPQYQEPQNQQPQYQDSPAPSGEAAAPAPQISEEQAMRLDQLMQGGTEAFSQGKYGESAEKFLQVSKEDPYNVDASLAFAVSSFATGDYSKAAEAIRQGVRQVPDVVNADLDIRQRYANQADFQKQFQALVDAINRNPGDTDARLVLAFIEHFANQRAGAKELFQQIRQVSPSDAELANAFLNAKTLDQIRADQQKAQSQSAQQQGATQGSVPTPTPQPSTGSSMSDALNAESMIGGNSPSNSGGQVGLEPAYEIVE